MSAAASALPLARLMVGTGAASLGDAVALTRHAAELGFAGALIIPPFYYKGVSDDGMLRLFARLVAATADKPIDLYLYNFPALSGVAYTPALVERLVAEFGRRIAGLKDFLRRPRLRGKDRVDTRPSRLPLQRGGASQGARRRIRRLHLGERQRQPRILRARLPRRRRGGARDGDEDPRAGLAQAAHRQRQGGARAHDATIRRSKR